MFISLPRALDRLSSALGVRFEAYGDPLDIEHAVEAQKRAVRLLPAEHPDIPMTMHGLGVLLHRKAFSPARSATDVQNALECFKYAANAVVGPLATRLATAGLWARYLHAHDERSPEVLAAFGRAVELMTLVPGLNRDVRRRYAQLREVAGLPWQAASVAVTLQRPDKALEWLEQGRLRAHDGELAEEVAETAKRLENIATLREVSECTMVTATEKMVGQNLARESLILANRWESLLGRVRAIPCLETFLLPPPCSHILRFLPPSGYIVVVNVYKDRCDAVILASGMDQPIHVPLPAFSMGKARSCRSSLEANLERYNVRMRVGSDESLLDSYADASVTGRGIRRVTTKADHPGIADILEGLWIDLVKPIIDRLGLCKTDPGTPTRTMPRIWWCPTGALSFLPIHAAGIYKEGHCEGLHDYAIPSYTPTVISLIDRVQNHRPPDNTVSGLFLTAHPNVRGMPTIPGTMSEVRSLHSLVEKRGIRVAKLEGDEATVDECLKHMAAFSSVHLACHASQDLADPLSSRFFFHRGSLDLQTIIQKDLRNADFAFLSACQTGAGEETLSDEAVHLAAGMLAAGYQRVVATMWSIEDRHAIRVAEEFYGCLLGPMDAGEVGASTGFDGARSAEALHYAVQRLRQRLDHSDRSLLAWVPTPCEEAQPKQPGLSSNHHHQSTETFVTLRNLTIEKTGGAVVESEVAPELKELWVQGIPGSGEGVCYSLTRASAVRWELSGSIELPADVGEIDLAVKGVDDEYLGYVHLDRRSMTIGDEIPGEGSSRRQDMIAFTSDVRLEMCWEGVYEGSVDVTTTTHTSKIEDEEIMDSDLSFDGLSEIQRLQRAVERASDDDPDLATHLKSLGTLLFQTQYEESGELSAIDDAISAQLRLLGVAVTNGYFGKLPRALSDLGLMFMERSRRTAFASDIEMAISTQQSVIELLPPDHKDLPHYLTKYAISVKCRFDRTGDLSDIDTAISAQRRAIDLLPEGSEDIYVYMINLGTFATTRANRTHDVADLDEAAATQRLTIPHIDPRNRRCLLGVFHNLGHTLMERFLITSDLASLDEAIAMQHRAVDFAPDNEGALPIAIMMLGTSYMHRFNHTDDLADIDEAIRLKKQAVEVSYLDYGKLPTLLGNLGASLSKRFEKTGDIRDIVEAIEAHQRAVDVTLELEEYREVPSVLTSLGDSHYARFKARPDNLEALLASLSAFKSGATSPYGLPSQRLMAAKRWAKYLREHSPRSPDIIAAFDCSLGLVELIAGLEHTLRGRYTQIKDIGGLVPRAASSAFSLGRPDKSLEWLEQGRCHVWSQLNNLRSSFDDLKAYDPDLAERVKVLAKSLETAGSARTSAHADMPLSEKMSVQTEIRDHYKLSQDWDILVDEVRRLPGFETFLRTPSCSSLLAHLPPSGYVVVINVHKRRCDALVLSAGMTEPRHVPLPDFTLDKARNYRGNLATNLDQNGIRMRSQPGGDGQGKSSGSSYSDNEDDRGIRLRSQRSNPTLNGVLRGLWEELVRPIIDALGLQKAPSTSSDLPRIWWCPSGPLSFLPIHAAGIYTDENAVALMDYAVSSYTPTVGSLIDRVKKGRPIDPGIAGLFLTSQPNAPGLPSIPGTTKEVQALHSRAAERGVRVLKVEGSALTADQCFKNIEEYSSLHLACHASQNAADPLASRFFFHEGALDLQTILQRDLKNADLAYLSACQTSAGEERLSEEAVHLAAGMLAAGYRRVVATMWSIGDRHAPEVARNFYEYLWKGMGEDGMAGGFDGSRSAEALHYAIQRLRQSLDNSDRSLLAWVPYVHFGY